MKRSNCLLEELNTMHGGAVTRAPMSEERVTALPHRRLTFDIELADMSVVASVVFKVLEMTGHIISVAAGEQRMRLTVDLPVHLAHRLPRRLNELIGVIDLQEVLE